ncbi:MAG: GIY-YIG nuclease family protein [Candidatus Eremiobacteraeota bacterium]|nr:GIY-YIG nuclease family protein [Candidatus Eremiobacteraeota bacterium]MBV8283873.1 GIY-YIG nuclease family protein [Candidatus Eremiobacteraeota bacterium]MBV8331668.1 GIY-YIG nuclease family protein [Candidatus Eremiobacteraeota bacterium]MBV8721978.1 GIY-YIG nuclease family protein [Candidatus Eremiobacteraeota bacterium]
MRVAEILPQRGGLKPKDRPAVYVLACADGSWYCGATTNLERRLAAHRRGTGSRYTRSRLPVRLLVWWHPASYVAAKSHEARFKALSRLEKERVIASDEAFGLPLCRQE